MAKLGNIFRVKGKKAGNKTWLSPETRDWSTARAVVKAARDSAENGEVFWAERYEKGRWIRIDY